MYQFQYTLSDKDYLEFNEYHLLNAPESKRLLWLQRLIVPAMFVIWLLLAFLGDEGPIAILIQLAIYALLAVAWILAVKPLNIFGMKRRIKSLKKHGKLPYGKESLIQFDEDFFTETTPETESKIKYMSIEKIAAGKTAMYIYTNSLQAVIVPLSVFETIEQRDAFWAFINHKAATAKAGS